MIAFILRRLLAIVPVLLGVLVITLVLFFGVSKDPVLPYAGQNPSAEQLRALRVKYELDVPAFYSPSWLRGEDLLDLHRHRRLAAVMASLGATIGTVDESTRRAVEDFRSRWPATRDLRGTESTINREIDALGLEHPPHVAFDDVALTADERAEVDARSMFDSQFFRVMRFRFADSMQYEESIWTLIARKVGISMSITIPMFLVGLAVELLLALLAARHRGRPLDAVITVATVLAMSVPFLSYIVFGQWIAAETQWFPVSGWAPGLAGVKYLAFPIAIGILAGLGSAVRFYRAVLLEEMEQDYVRTARAKGVREADVLFIHVLRNAGIPIVTRISVIIPFLITGSLLIERLFEIPGLGDLMLSGIQARDFWIVMPMTYLIAVVYSVAVLATDIAYALIDPRVRVS
ncbi:MAG: ABC transporter permease [Phycisphaerales bacterium]|nr:ABC transporter permease [Phycisphaerales bacterium]